MTIHDELYRFFRSLFKASEIVCDAVIVLMIIFYTFLVFFFSSFLLKPKAAFFIVMSRLNKIRESIELHIKSSYLA